jgi:EAL domain-containing protein (putative c-di-GMP-specific phosphodiesterase class I)
MIRQIFTSSCTIGSVADGHPQGRRNEKSGRTITSAIVALAKSLGLQVVAEGLETESQRELLVGIGCDLLQGYLFCRPALADKIEPLLQKQIDVPLARSA